MMFQMFQTSTQVQCFKKIKFKNNYSFRKYIKQKGINSLAILHEKKTTSQMSPIFLCTVRARSPPALQCDSRDEGKHVHCNLSKFSFINQDLLPPIQISGIWDELLSKKFPLQAGNPWKWIIIVLFSDWFKYIRDNNDTKNHRRSLVVSVEVNASSYGIRIF